MTDPVTLGSEPGTPYLAVDIVPDVVAGSFVLDVSELDGYDVLGWGGDPAAWVNVVCDVTRLTLTRGATRMQGVLTRPEAAECTVDLIDTARRFDPLANSEAVHTGTPVRVRAWGYDTAGQRWDTTLLTGTLRAVSAQYPKDTPPLVTFTASDLIGDLARWESIGRADPGTGDGQSLQQRAQLVLTETGYPTALADDIDLGYRATLAATTLATPWPDLLDAADAELGRLWVNSANELVVRARESALSGPVRGTFSDLHGETVNGAVHVCYSDVGAVAGVESLTNRAVAGRRVPNVPSAPLPASAVVQVDDETSQARYGVHTTRRTDLELQTDAQLRPWCESLLTTTSYPQLRIDSVTPAPWYDTDTALKAWPALCATDLGDRWLVRYRPALGPMVDVAVAVLGISLDVTPDAPWALVFHTELAPAPGATNTSGWFALDVSTLDGPDLLAPYGGAVA